MSSQYIFDVILIFILVRSFIFSLLITLRQILNAKSLVVGGRNRDSSLLILIFNHFLSQFEVNRQRLVDMSRKIVKSIVS